MLLTITLLIFLNIVLTLKMWASLAPETHQALSSFKVANGHEIDQKVIITQPQKDPTDCTRLHGKEFMDCMACQSSENVKKNITNCNDRMARHYFLNLSLEDYHEVLGYFSEEEWKIFYESRAPQERENFPKTRDEQLAMLKLIYLDAFYNNYEYLHNALEYLWSGNTRLSQDSLEKIIRDYHERCRNGSISSSSMNTLETKFYWRRKKLFAKT